MTFKPEAFRHSDHMQTDASRADHAECFSFQVEPPQSLQRKIIPERPHVHFMNVAGKRQDERKRMLRDGVLAVVRNIADGPLPVFLLHGYRYD